MRQQYLPDEVAGRRYYEPTRHGAEARYADRTDRIKAVLEGTSGDGELGDNESPGAGGGASSGGASTSAPPAT